MAKLQLGELRALKIVKPDGDAVIIFRNTVQEIAEVRQQVMAIPGMHHNNLTELGPWEIKYQEDIERIMMEQGPFATMDVEDHIYYIVPSTKQ